MKDFERRHQRGEDAPLIEVVRAIQQTHDSAITKLVDGQAQLATAVAVQATTIATIANTQQMHAAMLLENVKEHSAQNALVRFAIWVIPLVITLVVIVVNLTIHFAGPVISGPGK